MFTLLFQLRKVSYPAKCGQYRVLLGRTLFIVWGEGSEGGGGFWRMRWFSGERKGNQSSLVEYKLGNVLWKIDCQ